MTQHEQIDTHIEDAIASVECAQQLELDARLTNAGRAKFLVARATAEALIAIAMLLRERNEK